MKHVCFKYFIFILSVCFVNSQSDGLNFLVADALKSTVENIFFWTSKLWTDATKNATLEATKNPTLGDMDPTKILVRALIDVTSNAVKSFLPNYQPGLLNVSQDVWWGANDHQHENTEIRPFHIHFDNEMITDLRFRLRNRRLFTNALQNAANTYGTNDQILNHLLDYWEKRYDFQARESFLDRYPRYITNIQGLDIHYIHIKPEDSYKKTIPIMLMHGWPATSNENNKIINYLVSYGEKEDFALEIIAPDIPGYGYSQATNKIGLAPYQVGIIFKNLMERLGHKKFYLHAGDVGHWIASAMTVLFENDIIGYHCTLAYSFLPQTFVKYVLGQLYPPAVVEKEREDRLYPIATQLKFLLENFGYFHMHATRPDTVGKGLDDSPSALMSWIIQLIMAATDGLDQNLKLINGNLTNYEDLDDLIDTFTIYWDSQCITTSQRLYAEYLAIFQNPLNLEIIWTPTRVPFISTSFRSEIIYQPDNFIKDKYLGFIKSNVLDFGGHLYGFENPNVAAHYIWDAVETIEKKNVKDKIVLV